MKTNSKNQVQLFTTGGLEINEKNFFISNYQLEKFTPYQINTLINELKFLQGQLQELWIYNDSEIFLAYKDLMGKEKVLVIENSNCYVTNENGLSHINYDELIELIDFSK